MSRTDLNHRAQGEQARVAPRLEMVMPRLSHEQMVAILREGGVPESDARCWVEREARLTRDVSVGES